MLNMTKTLIVFSNDDKQHFWANVDDIRGFYNWGPCEKYLPQILSPFQKNFYVFNNSVETEKNIPSVP